MISGGKNEWDIIKEGITINGTITSACCIVLTLEEIKSPMDIDAQANNERINITA